MAQSSCSCNRPRLPARGRVGAIARAVIAGSCIAGPLGFGAIAHADQPNPTIVELFATLRTTGLVEGSLAMLEPTDCTSEASVWEPADFSDGDIRLARETNLRVMFHGNRFVVAEEIVAAFEKRNPAAKVSYTAIPPVHTMDKLLGRKAQFAELDEFGTPDIVMLPANALLPAVGDKLHYSSVRRVVLIARADDDRVVDAEAPVNRPELRIVFAGRASFEQHAMYVIPRFHYGAEEFDLWLHSPRASFSLAKHHRSVPARILAGCADVGFQFGQSQAYLERVKPGRFKFFDLRVTPRDLEREASFIYVLTRQNTLAKQFAEFMLSADAQRILAGYGLEK